MGYKEPSPFFGTKQLYINSKSITYGGPTGPLLYS